MNNQLTTKMIHCADIHLDARLSASFDYETAERRRAEILRTFVRMVEFAASEKVSAILIAGDLFDTDTIHDGARKTVLSCISSHPGITFFYLRGNHDGHSLTDSHTGKPGNLMLFDKSWSCYECGSIALYGTEFSSAGSELDYESLQPDPDMINIVMLHGQISGSAGGEEWSIDLRKLRNKGIDYLALGHIHAYQTGKLDGRGTYCYPGCPDGRGFDECGEHGFVLLEIDDRTKRVSGRFIPFASRRLYIVRADVTGCGTSQEMIRAAEDAIREEGCASEDLVRLVLTGGVDAECEKDPAYIRSAFSDRFFCFQLTDETELQFDMERHRLDRSLKGEFIRSVEADDSLSDAEKAEVIRYGLQALAGEGAK